MNTNKMKLLEFLGSSKRTFNIPVYQRNYDWKKEQCKRLFQDIESIVKNNYEYEHFLGTIVYVSGHTKPNFMEFKDHRHDQSVLTILSVKYNFELFRDPTQFGNDFKDQFNNSPYDQLFNHHRGKI